MSNSSVMRRWIETVVRHRVGFLIATVVITGALVSRIGQLRIEIDPNRFLPQSHPYVVTSNRVEDLFGSRYVLAIGITPQTGSVYEPEILGKVARITAKLREVPGVVKTNILSFSAHKAKSITGTADGMEVLPLMGAVPTTESEAQAVHRRVESNPAYRDIIVSGDERSVAVLAEFKDDPRGFRAILDKVEPIVAAERSPDVRIAIGGLPVLLGTLEIYSARLAFLLPLAMILIGVVLWFAFRSVQGLALPLLTATLAVLWSLGIMSLFHVPMDPFNATTPVLILAVASGHAVQILKRYYEEYGRESTASPGDLPGASRRAVVESLTRIGPVMLVAGIVAALGFLSLMVIEISSVRTFAVMAAGGILSSLVLELTLIPAVRSLVRPPKPLVPQQRPGVLSGLMNRLAGAVEGRGAAWIAAGTTIIVAASFWGATRIRYDDALKAWYFDSTPVIQDDNHLNRSFAGTNTLYVLVESRVPGRIQDPDVLRAMDGMQRYMQADPNVGRSLSIADFVRRMNKAMHADDPRYDTIPESRDLTAQYLFLYANSGDPTDFDTYVDYTYQHADIVTFLKAHDTEKLGQLIQGLKAYVAQHFPSDVSVSFGGSVAQGAAIHEIITHAKILNMLQLGAVFLVLSAIVFRSVIAGFLVLVPLALTVAVNFGVMGWAGIPFNTNNCITVAMAVGVGADYVIYLLFRLREERATSTSLTEAMKRTLGTAGSAIVFVAGSVAAGYSVLLLSYGFWNHIWMGILIGTAMVTSALAAIMVVPVLLTWVRPSFIFGHVQPAHASASTAAGVVVLLAGALGVALPTAPARAAEPMTPEQIMQRNFEVDRVPGSHANSILRLRNEHGQERVRESVTTTRLEDNATDNQRIIRFSSPADVKGTSILLIEHSAADDDMWIYLPALKKVRRLVSSNKKDSFVGSDFSYGDIIGYAVGEWHHTLTGEETVTGESCYVVESVPGTGKVRDDTGYSKRRTWVSKTRFVTLRTEIWDTEGQKLKEEEFGDFVNVDPAQGKWVFMKGSARNFQTGHTTDVAFSDYHLDRNVPQTLFTSRTLEFDQ